PQPMPPPAEPPQSISQFASSLRLFCPRFVRFAPNLCRQPVAPQQVRQSAASAMQPGFHRPHRYAGTQRNFAIAQSLNIVEKDRFPQFGWKLRERHSQNAALLRPLVTDPWILPHRDQTAGPRQSRIQRCERAISLRLPVMIDQQIPRHQIQPGYKRQLFFAKIPERAVDAQEYILREI